MPERSIEHASFVIERKLEASPERVFHAFADRKAKARWFAGPPEWEEGKQEFDFRVGGREHSEGGPKGGPIHSFDALYQDIVPNERIVYSYDMHLDGKRISVSLTTIEFKPEGTGTRLIFTEQGVFLDGYDNPPQREEGSRWLMDQLAASLGEIAHT
jgi:uncharacterized protein YndB with AHSA1/START domain